LGKQLESGHRNGKADRLTELENLIEKLTRYKAKTHSTNQEESTDMNSIRRFWKFLNSDIDKFESALEELMLPKKTAVKAGDVILYWE
jgi:hypothetical protein